MRIIIGLGNPGEKYKNTRHNAGFMCLNEIAELNNLEWTENKKFNALISKTDNTILLKPLSFMNNSGLVASKILHYYKLLPKKMFVTKKNSDLSNVLTVIHDDLDINLGSIKISKDSRSAGHNGVQSIIDHIKTKNFTRCRIGIKGEKPDQMPGKAYVLQKFNDDELLIINNNIKEITKNLGL